MSDRHDTAWVTDRNAALLTDLYELTMLQAYVREGMTERATFDLFVRRLPPERNFLLAAGLDDALHYLETARFDDEAIAYLRSIGKFGDDFLDWLKDFRFTGDVDAVPEGTPAFANEPLLQVTASLPEAQIAETFLMNQVHFQTVMASKAARVVAAAAGRAVVDFGARRMHGADATIKAARAYFLAGIGATSNLLAGKIYDIPVAGTMAHSYIQAHDDEFEAFRAFAEMYPDTVLLVDTYDTIEGVRKVIELAGQMGESFRVSAIRLDSGDLADLAKQARTMLDDAGLDEVGIFASGSLDEYAIRDLLRAGAPINGFGVGSNLGVSRDAPMFDCAYKLSAYAGEGRMKLSSSKSNLPARKQIYRVDEGADNARDIIARWDEEISGGRALLTAVMRNGRRTDAGRDDLETCRRRARDEIAALPARLHSLEPADPTYQVDLSRGLQVERERLAAGQAG